jgi:PAS domain S-box-containing protein
MKKTVLPLWERGSFRQQIIVAFVLGFLLLITACIGYMARTESQSLYKESDDAALGLARSLAVSSRSWVLANDVVGLQEVIRSFDAYPELRYAMVVSQDGRVLAHSDPEKTGLFLTDAASRSLLHAPAENRFLADTKDIIDIAVPIRVERRHVGWARVALGRERIVADMRDVVLRGIAFVLLASTLAFLAALIIAHRLGSRIGSLVRVAEGVRAGNFAERAVVAERRDEITRLADSFNRMLDTLAENEKELRTASQEVAELSQRNKMILDSAGEGIYGLDGKGVCTFANPAAAQMLGYRSEELVGRNSHALFHHTRPDGLPYPQDECPVQKAHKDGITHRGTDLYWRKDGGSFEVEYVSTPILQAGKPVGAVVVFRDISELKRTEMALRASERFLNSVVGHIPDMLFIKEAENLSFVRLNKAGEELLGYAESELLGKSDYDFFPKEEAEHFIANDREIIKNRQMADIPEEQITTKHLGLRYLHTKKIPIYAEDGKPLYLLGISEDITERKLAEEELRRYKDHLEEEVQQRTADLVLARNAAQAANQAKSVFLANMSHELRTPLNAILGFSSLMRKDTTLSDGQRQNLDIINRSGEHLLNLINDVLDMAKIEAGRVQLEEAPFDVGSMVRDVTDMMQIRATEKGLRLLVDQSSKFPRYLVGDEARLRQVLINLLGNAIKFTEQGGVTVRLGARRDRQARLLIEVEDSGPGIAPEDQERIFEPFVQLGEQGINRGTGLGLTITRQFVQLMGGSLGLESTLGKGSIFRVELPLKEAAESDIARPGVTHKGEVVSLAPGQPEYRILIVEDQRDNQLLLARLMETAGFSYRIAENGRQGVQMFREWRPHFIWMDRRMPVMDGLEATRQIRSLPGGKDVKIVAVTDSAFQEQRAEMLAAGMDDFVRKPYRANEIYDCLMKHLGVQYLYEGAAAQEAEAAELTPAALAKLPQDLRMELQAALESLESERIAAALQKVAAHDDALQKTLVRLIENFDYPAILKALQESQHA